MKSLRLNSCRAIRSRWITLFVAIGITYLSSTQASLKDAAYNFVVQNNGEKLADKTISISPGEYWKISLTLKSGASLVTYIEVVGGAPVSVDLMEPSDWEKWPTPPWEYFKTYRGQDIIKQRFAIKFQEDKDLVFVVHPRFDATQPAKVAIQMYGYRE